MCHQPRNARTQRVYAPEIGQVHCHPVDDAAQIDVCDPICMEDRAHTGGVQRVSEFRLLVQRVQRHNHHAGFGNCILQQYPLRVVRCPDRNVVAGCVARSEQGPGECSGQFIELGIAETYIVDFAVAGVYHCLALRVLGGECAQ